MRHAAFALAAMLTAIPAVHAQTITIHSVKDATVRGGRYAASNYGDEPTLETRQSDDPTYARRAAMTFDTDTTLPANARIASAKLLLTVKGGNAETRRLAACTIPVSFDESSVSWKRRRGSRHWENPGVDIVDGTCSEAVVTGTANSRVTFDVTSQVQKVVNGAYGSRYARFLVGDLGGSSRDSYKQFYSNNDPSSAVRPTLIVTLGTITPTPEPPAPTPDPPARRPEPPAPRPEPRAPTPEPPAPAPEAPGNPRGGKAVAV